MLLLLDNYDSFTYNLYDYFVQCGASVEVVRNDKLDLSIVNQRYSGIIISPGPGNPSSAGCTMEVLKLFHQSKPIFGVCLGMQAIGEFFGAQLVKSKYPMHGKLSQITIEHSHPLFKNLKSPIAVCRYHSLVIQNLENTELIPLSYSEDRELMALAHRELPICGVQFHPEAILTQHGLQLIRNWLTSLSLEGNKLKNY